VTDQYSTLFADDNTNTSTYVVDKGANVKRLVLQAKKKNEREGGEKKPSNGLL